LLIIWEGLAVETEAAVSYKGFRFPAEIISHAVWLYHRFPLSYREVEELLLARGIVVSHETIRAWCDLFGPQYAAALRRRRPQAGDKWHLDEVFVKIRRLTGGGTTCGGPSTRTGTSWTSCCSPSGTPRPPSASWPSW
jgi:hypothetical protein